MAFPDTWGPFFFCSIARKGGSDVEIAAMIDPFSVEINQGDYPGESLPNGAGGRVWKEEPQEDGEITFDIIRFVELDTTSAVGLAQQFAGVEGGAAYDTSEPLADSSSWTASLDRTRDLFRIAFLWTNDGTTAATGAGATAASTDSLRFYANDCRIISHKTSQSDGFPKVTVTLKYPAFNLAGTTKNGLWQSGDNTALVTLGSYS